MNKYLDYVFTLSFCVLAFKSYLPEFLNHELVQLPALLVFGITAPIGFSLSLRNYFSTIQSKQLVHSLSYLLIYLLILGSALAVVSGMSSTYYLMNQLEQPRAPQVLFKMPNEAPELEGRIFGARVIYREYGARVAYKIDSGLYKVYEPSDEDMSVYKEKSDMASKTKKIKQDVKELAHQGMYISLYLICSFFILFSLTLYFQHKKHAVNIRDEHNAT